MLEKSRIFYEEYVKKMIRDKFLKYEERIATGVVGEGSDCFFCDDEISADHDYGVGLCLWLTKDDFLLFGNELNREYQSLLKVSPLGSRLNYRRGVINIGSFYEGLFGFPVDEASFEMDDASWFYTPEDKFATATNGEVFRDDIGVFTFIREKILSYYPEKIWLMRLTNALHDFSATGQSNYARSMARGDYTSALICRAKAVESAMDIAYLLNKKFAPYYKWKRKLLEKLQNTDALIKLLDEICALPLQKEAWADYKYDPKALNKSDKIETGFDRAGDIISKELLRNKLTDIDSSFLETHCERVASKIGY